ncbi:MAG: hypothetical protein AAB434_06675 [Planctomycetota bacterium]
MSIDRMLEIVRVEYNRRRLKDRAYVTLTNCLGPCEEGNICFLYANGQGTWFRGMNTDPLVRGLMDYLDQVTQSKSCPSPPEPLASQVFTRTHADLPRPQG